MKGKTVCKMRLKDLTTRDEVDKWSVTKQRVPEDFIAPGAATAHFHTWYTFVYSRVYL